MDCVMCFHRHFIITGCGINDIITLCESNKTDQAIEQFKEVLNRYKDEEAIGLARNYLEKIESE